jgi:hypothetical protein
VSISRHAAQDATLAERWGSVVVPVLIGQTGNKNSTYNKIDYLLQTFYLSISPSIYSLLFIIGLHPVVITFCIKPWPSGEAGYETHYTDYFSDAPTELHCSITPTFGG